MSENIENTPSSQVSEEGTSAAQNEQTEQDSQQSTDITSNENVTDKEQEVKQKQEKEVSQEELQPPTNVEEAKELVKNKGFNYDELQQEFNANGCLLEETIKALEKQGISRNTIEKFTNDQQQLVAKQMNEIVEYIGGAETFESVRNWAIANLSDTEKAEIDKEHNPTRIKLLLDGLKARMDREEGVLPQQISGEGGEATDGLFESLAEMRAAIKDPRYNEDEVYREKVSRKITASKQAGKIKL